MQIWFTEIGEPLPIEKDARLYRYGMLTMALAKYGHEIVWWASSFSHISKRQLCERDTDIQLSGITLKLITGQGYGKSVSLQRILHHRDFAKKFNQNARRHNPPDIIISPVPTLEVAEKAVRYGEEFKIPVLTDIRDEWPDEFVNLAPKYMRAMVRLIAAPYYSKMKYICRNATGIMAMSERQLNYGLAFANRPKGSQDAMFPHGYDLRPVDPEKVESAKTWWLSQGIDPNAFICCFFGTIGNFFNLRTVIESMKILSKEFKIQAVLCGEGSSLHYYKEMAMDLDSVMFPGWVDSPRINALMSLSHVGLAPYAADTRMSLPNKPFEYFAGGLPVVSSIQGELKDLLTKHDCGRTYPADSVDEFCHIVRELRNSEQLRKAMGIRARQLLEKKFSIDKIASQLNDYLTYIVKDYYPSRIMVRMDK